MAIRLSVEVAHCERKIAEGAARWCGEFYHDVGVSLEPDRAVLSSNARRRDELVAIWSAALINEQAATEAQELRLRILDRLGQ